MEGQSTSFEYGVYLGTVIQNSTSAYRRGTTVSLICEVIPKNGFFPSLMGSLINNVKPVVSGMGSVCQQGSKKLCMAHRLT